MDTVTLAILIGIVLVVLTVWLTPLLSQYDPVPKKLGGATPSTGG